MEGFAGICYRDGKEVSSFFFKNIAHLSASRFTLHSDRNISENIAIAKFGMDYNDDADGIEMFRDDKLEIVCDAKLHNKRELGAALGINDRKLSETTGAEYILKAYRKWGRDCLYNIAGNFAFVIWDGDKKTFFCACDPIGQKQLYYYLDDKKFVFSNRLAFLSQFSFAGDFDENWITVLLLNKNENSPRTIFKKIKSLVPGQCLYVDASSSKIESYWQEIFQSETACSGVKDAIEGLKWHLSESVRLNIGEQNNVGIELSSGLDSTGIAAIAQNLLQQKGQNLVAFSNVLHDDARQHSGGFVDEWAAASRVVEHIGITKHVAVSSSKADSVKTLSDAVDLLGQPTNVILSLAMQGIYDKANENHISLLLSGFGGNEMITEHVQVMYVYRLIRSGKFRTLVQHIASKGNPVPVALMKAGYYILQRYTLNKKFEKNVITLSDWMIFNENWISNAEVEKALLEYFKPAENYSLREQGLSRISAGSTKERILTGNLLAKSHGIEYAYPLLYIPLLKFYHGLPDFCKVNYKMDRGPYREVVKSYLPADIVAQKKNIPSSTIPFARTQWSHNFDLLKNWCLSLPQDHLVFTYVDRNKILKAEANTPLKPAYGFRQLSSAAMMAMAFDKVKQQHLVDV